MQLADALAALIAIEERMAGYYAWLSTCFAEDAEACRCFHTLAEQERGHANQLGLQHRMVRSGKVEAEVQLDRAALDALVEKVDRFQRQNPRPPLPHAVLFALRLESGAIEQAYQSLLADASPELAGLARSMIRADEKHAVMLRELMKKRGSQRRP